MDKIRISLLILAVSLTVVTAEARENKINLIAESVALENLNHPYSDVAILDTRANVEKVQLAIDEQNMSDRLRQLIKNFDKNQSTSLVIEIKRLQKINDKYFIQARAYAKDQNAQNSYVWLNTLSTSFNDVYDLDETRGEIVTTILNFIKDELSGNSRNLGYATNSLEAIELIEKQNIKAYSENTLKDGIYWSYKSFAMQTPERSVSDFKMKNDELKSVYYFGEINQKNIEVNPQRIYAVVIKGNLYLQKNNHYVPTFVDADNDFCLGKFDGTSVQLDRSWFSEGDLQAAGLAGTMLFEKVKTGNQPLVVIDHLSGENSIKFKSEVKFISEN